MRAHEARPKSIPASHMEPEGRVSHELTRRADPTATRPKSWPACSSSRCKDTITWSMSVEASLTVDLDRNPTHSASLQTPLTCKRLQHLATTERTRSSTQVQRAAGQASSRGVMAAVPPRHGCPGASSWCNQPRKIQHVSSCRDPIRISRANGFRRKANKGGEMKQDDGKGGRVPGVRLRDPA